MFWTPVIETIISLIFTFLILSVICSAIFEWISERRNMRGQLLSRFLHTALDDPTGRLPNIAHMILRHPLVRSSTINPKREVERIDPKILADTFIEVSDQCIEFLEGESSANSLNLNSVPEGVFKSINFSHTRSGNKLEDSIRRERALDWYSSMISMTRYHYKRKARQYLFFIGLIFAALFNVDTLHLIDRYWSDSQLRGIIVAHAEKFIEGNKEGLNYQFNWEDFREELKTSNTNRFSGESIDIPETPFDYLRSIPLGWNFDGFKGESLKVIIPNLLMMFLGWIITAAAITFGAPFWYDVLQKMFKVRSLKSS